MQDRLDHIPDQLRAHARSLHEILETRGSDEHSGGGFCSTSVIVSSERDYNPAKFVNAVTTDNDTRGRSPHRRASPSIGIGARIPSNRAHHASPVVLDFYADMVVKDAGVVDSAHVRGEVLGRAERRHWSTTRLER